MLVVNDLHAYYGKSHILQGVDIAVGENEIVSILGRNGVGRSTTLKAIMGDPEPRGEITFRGKRVTGAKPHEIAHMGIGFVPEERAIFPTLTVEQNLLLGIKRGVANPRWSVEETWKLFPQLKDRANAPGGALSGGEQQMLAIGRGLMAAPKIVLFDEPSLGLSPMLSKAVLSAIRGLKERGVASLLVEQNMRAALKIADRGYVLRVGRITAEGSAKELAESPDIQRAYLGL